jgi:uncharacterized protein YqhQ
MEGVMMRSRQRMAVAVRHPAGHIVVKAEDIVPGRLVRLVRRVPIFRGVVVLWDVLILGMRTLAFSANIGLENADDDGLSDLSLSNADPTADVVVPTGDSSDDPAVWGMLGMGLVLGVGLFFVLPLFVTKLTDPIVESDIISNLIEGFIRLSVFVLYLYLIGRLEDIRRTFQYHGAEHMTVNALERGQELSISNVSQNSLTHPRCGTNFLLVIVVISVFVFAFLGRPDLPLRIASRIVMIPFIAGIAFELIRVLSTRVDRPVARLILKPGLWLQGLTTRPPTTEQIEVAIVAMSEVLRSEDEHTLVSQSLQPTLEDRT